MNYRYQKDEIYYNWIVIILALYFFFPIGIYLFYKKVTLHRRNIFTSGNTATNIGIAFPLIGLLFILLNFSSFLGGLFIVFGTIMLIAGRNLKKKARKYQKYLDLIVNEKIDDINVIMIRMQLTKGQVVRDINNLIERRYLENYFIHPEQDKLYTMAEVKADREKQRAYTERQRYERVTKCPNCGANSLIQEKIGRCAYCNSYIE